MRNPIMIRAYRQSIKLSMVVLSCLLISACVEFKQAGKIVGHTTRDVAREIGHGTRDVAKQVGKGAAKVAKSITASDSEASASAAATTKSKSS
jgi:hypothetical protein